MTLNPSTPLQNGVCGTFRLYEYGKPLNYALETDPILMDTNATTLTNEIFSLTSPSSLFNNDETDLVNKEWNQAETKAMCNTLDKTNSLDTPDVFKDLDLDLGFGSWSNTDLGITLDDPFLETYMNLGDGCSLDLFPDVLPLADGCHGTVMADTEAPCTAEENSLVETTSEVTCEDAPSMHVMHHSTDEIITLTEATAVIEEAVPLADKAIPAVVLDINDLINQLGGQSSEPMICEEQAVSQPITTDAMTDDTSNNMPELMSLEQFLVSEDIKFVDNVETILNLDEAPSSSTTLNDILPTSLELSSPKSSSIFQDTNTIINSESHPPLVIAESASLSKTRKRSAEDKADHSADKRMKVIEQEAVKDKHTLRRIKNNIASRHSRASRKNREKELSDTADRLETENIELKKQVEELSRETEFLRKILVERLSSN